MEEKKIGMFTVEEARETLNANAATARSRHVNSRRIMFYTRVGEKYLDVDFMLKW